LNNLAPLALLRQPAFKAIAKPQQISLSFLRA
jgi:hypothetical protein